MSNIRIVFASVNKWNKTIFTLKKIIISCVNYRTLHVKQADVASGVLPETKPLLREPNNYIKRAFSPFSSFSVVRPTQFFGIIQKKKKKRKKIRRSWTFLTLINSFNFKDRQYDNISRHKRFGGVSFLLWNRPSYFPPYSVCFDLVTRSSLAYLELVGARKNEARERDTRISSRARSLSRPTSSVDILNSASRILQCWLYYMKVNSARRQHDSERTQNRAGLWLMFLLRSACYTAICLLVFKLHHRKPTLLFVNCTWKNLPALFLHKNKKRGDLVGNGMGLGLVPFFFFFFC